MAENETGGHGPGLKDERASDLRDTRQGAYDPVGNQVVPDTSKPTPREKAQPGASMQGEPVPAKSGHLPEGLKRKRTGPYSKTRGRGNEERPAHVPGPPVS